MIQSGLVLTRIALKHVIVQPGSDVRIRLHLFLHRHACNVLSCPHNIQIRGDTCRIGRRLPLPGKSTSRLAELNIKSIDKGAEDTQKSQT